MASADFHAGQTQGREMSRATAVSRGAETARKSSARRFLAGCVIGLGLCAALFPLPAFAQFVCGGSATGAATQDAQGATTGGGTGNVACGSNAQAGVASNSTTDATALGDHSVASNVQSTAIGQGSTASGNSSTVVGQGSMATGDEAVVIGQGSMATAQGAMVLGQGKQGYRARSNGDWAREHSERDK